MICRMILLLKQIVMIKKKKKKVNYDHVLQICGDLVMCQLG